jgi:2'-5' RNA ligase
LPTQDLTPAIFTALKRAGKNHDPLYPVVKPHFTCIFPTSQVTVEEFTGHVLSKVIGRESISFSLDKASVHEDFTKENSYVFLVPGKGFAEMIALYDCLNEELPGKREPIPGPFLPHITIGKTPDKSACDQIAAGWNSNHEIIQGKIDVLEIIQFGNQQVKTLKTLSLPGENR